MACIGIDVAKRLHVLSAVDDDGRTVVESFRFANTDAGFKRLLGRLEKAGVGPESSLAGMEAAGAAGRPCSVSWGRTAATPPS